MLIARLCAGQIDVAFIWRPTTIGCDLSTELLVDEDTVIAVPTAHPLSKVTFAPLAALAKETLVLNPRALNPCDYDSIIAACQRAGFNPAVGQEAPQVVSVMPMVAAGFGVSIVPRSTSRILVDGVHYVRIEADAPRVKISLAHQRGDRSRAVENLVAVARAMRMAGRSKNDNSAE